MRGHGLEREVRFQKVHVVVDVFAEVPALEEVEDRSRTHRVREVHDHAEKAHARLEAVPRLPAHVRFVLDELQEKLSLVCKYPPTKGLPELREASALWLSGRFKVKEDSLDADCHVLPVNGTREALFSFVRFRPLRTS